MKLVNREHSPIFPSGGDTGYEDVCFPINTCNKCNQIAISLPTVSLI